MIEITAEMIEAGFEEAREFVLGGDIRELVKSIYMAMEIERHSSFDHPALHEPTSMETVMVPMPPYDSAGR